MTTKEFNELRRNLYLNRLWISLGYGLLGSVYIVVSSGLLSGAVLEESLGTQAMFEIAKGLGFVWGSALLIYLATRAADVRHLLDYRKLLSSKRRVSRLNHLQNLKQVTGGLTHDLRNVLQIIHLHLRNLRTSASQEKMERTAEAVERELERVVGMCDTLTEACEPKGRTKPEAIYLPEFIRKEIAMVQPLVSKGEINFQFEDDIPAIKCERTSLHRLTLNLLYNAAQAAGEAGVINVELSRDGDRILMRMTNDGEPIPQELVRDINQEIDSKQRISASHGWGVSIIQDSVESLGANLEVDQLKDGGAEFEVAFQA